MDTLYIDRRPFASAQDGRPLVRLDLVTGEGGLRPGSAVQHLIDTGLTAQDAMAVAVEVLAQAHGFTAQQYDSDALDGAIIVEAARLHAPAAVGAAPLAMYPDAPDVEAVVQAQVLGPDPMDDPAYVAYCEAEEARGELAGAPEKLPCHVCTRAAGRAYGFFHEDTNVQRKVVKLGAVTCLADPTQTYVLECGHVVI